MNIGTIIAENIFAKIYNGSNLITSLSLGNVAVGGSSTATYEYIAALTGGTHILTAVVDGDTECLASNNNGNTSLQVTAGTCKDGVQNQGEESLDCGGPCTACSTLTTTSSSSSGGGGGGGGGGHGNIYFLTLTATNPKKTMSLETADTVRFAYDGKTYSISFKQFKSDSAKFSLAREFSTKSYEVKANVTQKLDLDLDGVDDLSVTPTKMKYWKSDVMFGLLGVAKYSIPTYVLPTVTKNKTSDYKSASSKTPLKTGETGTVKKKVESITQGVLDFVESFDVKKSTPAWAGVGVSLLVIVVGMVGYYFVARKYD